MKCTFCWIARETVLYLKHILNRLQMLLFRVMCNEAKSNWRRLQSAISGRKPCPLAIFADAQPAGYALCKLEPPALAAKFLLETLENLTSFHKCRSFISSLRSVMPFTSFESTNKRSFIHVSISDLATVLHMSA